MGVTATGRRSRASHRLAWSVGVASLLAMAGCNILGPAMYFAAGEPDIKAQYELDEAKTGVVFIDDRRSAVPTRSARRAIGAVAEREMLTNKAATDLVRGADAMAVAAREDYDAPLGIAEIGQAVGADYVVYATIDAFALSTDGQSLSPAAAMRVKVIDVATNERVWPAEDKRGATVQVTLPRRTGPAPSDPAQLAAVERELAEAMGDTLAKLFYTHSQDSSKTRVGDTRPQKGI